MFGRYIILHCQVTGLPICGCLWFFTVQPCECWDNSVNIYLKGSENRIMNLREVKWPVSRLINNAFSTVMLYSVTYNGDMIMHSQYVKGYGTVW